MHSNGKILFLDEKIVYQSFYDALLTFSSFSSRKISCVSARVCKSLAKCSLCEGPHWKNDISGFIWHKSFIQTIQCSSFNQRIVYQILWLTSCWFCDGWILPGSVDLNTRPFSNSAGDGILKLRGVVGRANRARSMSSFVSLHFRIVFLTVWTWRSTNPWPCG